MIDHSDLTPEQKNAVTTPAHENNLVLGTPGSGKTQVLLQRAAYLVQSCGISIKNIRIFVVTDVMEKFIRWEFESMGYPEETVTAFDYWCRFFYLNHISQDLPRIYINGRVDEKKTRYSVLDILKNNKNLQKNMKFVLVDDGQDMSIEAFEILSLAAQHITVFSDPHQNLSEETPSESFVRDMLKLNRRNFLLRRDFRCPHPVAQLASLFIDEDKFRQAYSSEVRSEQSMSEDPLCCIAQSEEHELNHLSEVVRQRQAMNEKVGIFVPTNSFVHRVAKVLKEHGIETEKAIPMDAQNVIHKSYDFGNDLPKITTYPMAKGLTFDSVLMPRLTENAFSKIPPFLRHRHLFMGITRASKWVYMSTVKGKECKEIHILKSAETDGHLTIFH